LCISNETLEGFSPSIFAFIGSKKITEDLQQTVTEAIALISAVVSDDELIVIDNAPDDESIALL